MARIRTIKPEFFSSGDIVRLGPWARLLYIALWMEADREGRMEWKPETFKSRYFPDQKVDIMAMCDALLDEKLVVLYRPEDELLAWIPKFLKHQIINNREAASRLPAPTPENTLTRESGVKVACQGKEGRKEGKERKEGTLRACARETFLSMTLPKCLNDDEGRGCWEAFCDMRLAKKKDSFTEMAAAAILRKLEPFDSWTAKEALRNSVISNWSGVFPESVKRKQPSQTISDPDEAVRRSMENALK
jgi:hypothetical protein